MHQPFQKSKYKFENKNNALRQSFEKIKFLHFSRLKKNVSLQNKN
jgi:hypothetical protein